MSEGREEMTGGDGVNQPSSPNPPPTRVLRMRGLPFEASEADVKEFFGKYTVEEALICFRQGRPSGEAYVRLDTEETASGALEELNKAHMGRRYIELFESSAEEMNAKRSRQHGGGSQYLLRLRGLPFTATAADVEEFFSGIPIARGTSGITFVYNGNGSLSGECFVEFPSDQDRAEGLKRDRETMGKRYIEIFVADQGDLAAAMRQRGRAPGRGGMRGRGRGGRGLPGNVEDTMNLLQGLNIGHGNMDNGPGAAGRGGGGQWGAHGGRGEQPYAGIPSMDPMRGQPMMPYANPATGMFMGAPGPYITGQQQEASHQHMAQGVFGMWPMQQQQQQLPAYRAGASTQPGFVSPGFAGEPLGATAAPMAPYLPHMAARAGGAVDAASSSGGVAPGMQTSSPAAATGTDAGWLGTGTIEDFLDPSGAPVGLQGGAGSSVVVPGLEAVPFFDASGGSP